MPNRAKKFYHIHLVSDATGETLNTVARAAAAQYADFQAVEHVHALIRTPKRMARVIQHIEEHPGVVLYTIVNDDLQHDLETACGRLQVPCISVLDPVISTLATYLNTKSRPQVGGQYALNAEYFRRIDALNFTMMHDDGQHTESLNDADIVLLGISRTSKTPTSIYLANRGVKVANVPIIRNMPPPRELLQLEKPLVVGLLATTERIAQIRRNRLLSLNEAEETSYVDKKVIAEEINYARQLCTSNHWPMIDVTRRSIEETAAAILNLYHEREEETR